MAIDDKIDVLNSMTDEANLLIRQMEQKLIGAGVYAEVELDTEDGDVLTVVALGRLDNAWRLLYSEDGIAVALCEATREEKLLALEALPTLAEKVAERVAALTESTKNNLKHVKEYLEKL